jgi:spore coat polysaccharide biosynthesis protein SpsF
MTRKITIVQARMSSTRLPGKIMKEILGKTVLELQLERMSLAKNLGQIVVAISENKADDMLEKYCQELGYEVFRGSENDLLSRHYHCALKYEASIVAKIPSDCPLIDPSVIDRVFHHFENQNCDYVSNLHPATYPDGNDCEVFRFEALERAYREAERQLEREHTTPYFWENPDIFSISNLTWESGLDYSMSHRFTIDYMEDFEFIKAVYEELYRLNTQFSLRDILDLIDRKPEIYQINSTYAGVNWYRNHLDELATVNEKMTKKC